MGTVCGRRRQAPPLRDRKSSFRGNLRTSAAHEHHVTPCKGHPSSLSSSYWRKPVDAHRVRHPSTPRLCHKAVSQGPDLDEVGIVTLRFSLRRCGETALRTTGSHPPRRTFGERRNQWNIQLRHSLSAQGEVVYARSAKNRFACVETTGVSTCMRLPRRPPAADSSQ